MYAFFLISVIIKWGDIVDTAWLNVGDQIEVEIKKQGINGEGVAYHNKLAIFVDGAITREVVLCSIVNVYPKYATAKIEQMIRPSNRRVTPPCPYYDRCGGCQLQHIEYLEQLKMKQSILKQALRRYTALNVDTLPIQKTIGQKPGFGYRNKSQMPFRNTIHGLELGLFKPGSNHFVTVKNCIVQEDAVNQVNQLVLDVCKKYQLKALDNQHRDGNLLHLVTRHMKSTNQVQVTFVVVKKIANLPEIAAELMKLDSRIQSIHQSLNQANSLHVFGASTTKVAGHDTIRETVEGLEIALSPDAFHQLNTDQMVQLYRQTLAIGKLKATDTIIDAFCGIGITSLLMAKHVRRVIGIDYSESSIQDATKNAKANNITNVRFVADQVERAIPQMIIHNGTPDVILFDPPRSGLEESTIQMLKKTKIPKIIYISCNPSTLAKNLADLIELYTIQTIQPIDMFPHTASVESITLLTIK